MYHSVVRLLGRCSSLGPARHAHEYKYIQWLYVHFMVARIRIHCTSMQVRTEGLSPNSSHMEQTEMGIFFTKMRPSYYECYPIIRH